MERAELLALIARSATGQNRAEILDELEAVEEAFEEWNYIISN